MIFSTATLLFVHLVCVSASFIPKANGLHLTPRATSDPCCKSCGPIGEVLADCPLTTTDVFCGCDKWVKAAPTCQACIINSRGNTSYAVNPGPVLEIFWALCRCQTACRPLATDLFAPEPCNFGTDPVCASKGLVNDGPECLCCLEKKDEWLTSWLRVEIEEAAAFLATGINAIPGSSHFLW